MKYFLGVLLLTIAGTLIKSAYIGGNGQPGCKTEQELQIRIFRNNWDPSAFWKCENLNEPAAYQRCPDEKAFLDKDKDCVNWRDWQWEDPVEPLSYPDQD